MAWLLLEDGSKFQGNLIGSPQETLGEVVFNTSMCGYQEILTDPACHGQIVVMTYPMIGNYGINSIDSESDIIHPTALIIHEHCDHPSNWQNQLTVGAFLKQKNVVALTGVDTRALTRHIRKHGSMHGMILVDKPNDAAFAELKDFKPQIDIASIGCQQTYTLGGTGAHLAVIDLGARKSLLRSLLDRSCKLTVFPPSVTAEQIAQINPDGIVIGGGTGDPNQMPDLVNTLKQLLYGKPLLGIELGLHLLTLAAGGEVVKQKYGHHGNQPVKDLQANRCFITAQHHIYEINAQSLPEKFEVSHRNWNDQGIEGLRLKNSMAWGLQFQPEYGMQDGGYLLDEFVNMAQSSKEE